MRIENLFFKKIHKNDSPPYELLLLADPSKEMIDSYLKESNIFVALLKEEIVGVAVLLPLPKDEVEIKNIAVKSEFQSQGIGTFLIKKVLDNYKNHYRTIYIGTANSSITQLNLYQKLGFEIEEIKKNFFIENYSEPIFENGIQAKDMVMLKIDLLKG